jgi:uncharacterized protein
MSTIAVIGGTGYAGSFIVKEAAARGHQVVSLSRSLPAEPIDGVSYIQGNAADAAQIVAGADVVIGALSPRAGTEGTLVVTYAKVGDLAAETGARLIVVGGFSSLRPTADAPRFAEGDDLPAQFADEAREGNAVLMSLSTTASADLDWLFVSPAAAFGSYTPQGQPRGTYRTSTDVALFDGEGASAIEGADFATAIINEVETPTRRRSQIHFAY